MPNLNEALNDTGVETNVISDDGIVDVAVVEKPEEEEAPVAKTPKKKKKASEKVILLRPPLEQITKDFEKILSSKKIGDRKLEKLGYKCGKIIWGLKSTDGKDFRAIAFKARKKSRSVDGKSRGIFYFGINQETAKELTKAHKGINVSKFGICSVQSKTPVEIVLDRNTFTNIFDKNTDAIMELMENLVDKTLESKTIQLAEVQAKIEAKKEKATAKKKKAAKEATDK